MFARGYGFADRYYSVGQGVLLKWLKHLEKHGFNLRTLGAVMEFGCGTSRLLQHFRNIEGLRIVGTDANPKMAQWCSENISGIEYHHNELNPPLEFAEDNSFDLIYAFSVFTHIPAEAQRPWLREMRRILRPGGFLLCTVAGYWLQRMFVSESDADRLQRDGYLQYPSGDQNASLSTQVGGSGWDIYQPRNEVIRIFGFELDLIDYIPDAQDLLILRKPKVV